MKSYTAYCMNEDGENLCMTREYEAKKHFIDDLHGNGYKVHFVALTEKYDEESQKYNERRIAKNRAAKIRRDNAKAWAKRHEERRAEIEARYEAEETTTEENKEEKTMKFKKEFLNVEIKPISKYNAIRFDADTAFYITNCTEEQEPEALRKSLEKFIELLRKHGGVEILVASLEMNLNCNEYNTECTFNEIKNGGNAYEIGINRYDDTTLSIYIRICEHQDTPEEQNEEEQPEEIPSFESVKNQLLAKVEHIENSTKPEGFKKFHGTLWAREGQDLAVTVWNGSERVTRETADAWEESTGLTLREIINEAIRNTMATQKPRLHRSIFDSDDEAPETSALLESCFVINGLDDDKTVMINTTEKKGGAIALFYPPVLSKICELFGGSGYYVAFTSLNEAMIHKFGSIDLSSIRRNVRETNNIFGPADTLSDYVFYYEPKTKRLLCMTEF